MCLTIAAVPIQHVVLTPAYPQMVKYRASPTLTALRQKKPTQEFSSCHGKAKTKNVSNRTRKEVRDKQPRVSELQCCNLDAGAEEGRAMC